MATAGLSAPAIAAPIRHVLRAQSNVAVLMDEVQRIDLQAREVICGDRVRGYDFLIVAAGAQTSYFGNDSWAEAAPGLKTLADAFEIRRRVLEAFEHAEVCDDAAERDRLLSFAVIGGGPTGVELAGTLAEIARHTLRSEFRRIDPAAARICLIEGGPRILGAFSEASSRRAAEQLESLGVKVMPDRRVVTIDATGVDLMPSKLPAMQSAAPAERLHSATVLWAAGVRASPLGAGLQASVDRSGRVSVTGRLSLDAHPEVYVVGDMAQVPSHSRLIPGVAPAAKQMGRHAARNLLARIANRPESEFVYRDYGSLATIGRHAAVVEFGSLRFSGFAAWTFWLWIHIFFLIGFRNRFVVLLDWAWSYLSFERFARIVTASRKS